MRWMWTVVVCCLVAAGGPRPSSPERGDPYSSQMPHLEKARASLSALASRRDTASAPEFRLPPFILITPASLTAPARHATASEPRALADRFALVVATCSARGPPVV